MSDPSNKKSTASSSTDPEEKEEGETNTGPTMAAVPDIDSSTAAKVEAKSERKRAEGTGEGEERTGTEPLNKKLKSDDPSDNREESAEGEEAEKPPERLNFPGKLMDLLQREDKPEGIYWLPCGTIFAMNTTKMEDILVNKFQGAKFMSFTRTLNKW